MSYLNQGVRSYPERTGVDAGFHFNQAEGATPTQSQERLIKPVESGVTTA